MKRVLGISIFIIVVSTLLSTTAFTAEKVFFYHTDPAGTPLAMTDDSGKVVWRADYKPFGEEQAITGSIENNEKFVGKEKDKETGLYYFGARYMRPEIGRFISPDQVGPVDPRTSKTNHSILLNPQKLNRYAYSLNNPYRYIDPDGKWPTAIHNIIINEAFQGDWRMRLPDKVLKIFKEASHFVDQDQSPEGAYKHAMSSSKLTKEEARDAMNKFIKEKVNQYHMLMSQGKTDEAYFALGEAMHPIMDSTSPSHKDFQEWRTKDLISHTQAERKISPEDKAKTVEMLREFFRENR